MLRIVSFLLTKFSCIVNNIWYCHLLEPWYYPCILGHLTPFLEHKLVNNCAEFLLFAQDERAKYTNQGRQVHWEPRSFQGIEPLSEEPNSRSDQQRRHKAIDYTASSASPLGHSNKWAGDQRRQQGQWRFFWRDQAHRRGKVAWNLVSAAKSALNATKNTVIHYIIFISIAWSTDIRCWYSR